MNIILVCSKPECPRVRERVVPTSSPAARRPPTRSRVPWTRRTRLRPGRSPRSRSRIPLGPAGTGSAGSSAPAGELGPALWGVKDAFTVTKRSGVDTKTSARVVRALPWQLPDKTYMSAPGPCCFPRSTSSFTFLSVETEVLGSSSLLDFVCPFERRQEVSRCCPRTLRCP